MIRQGLHSQSNNQRMAANVATNVCMASGEHSACRIGQELFWTERLLIGSLAFVRFVTRLQLQDGIQDVIRRLPVGLLLLATSEQYVPPP